MEINPAQATEVAGWSFAWMRHHQSRTLSADETGFLISGNQMISGLKGAK